jgi:hypothetical protein
MRIIRSACIVMLVLAQSADLAIAAAFPGGFPVGSWKNSCRDAKLVPWEMNRFRIMLVAVCRRNDGTWASSDITFSRCPDQSVANVNGQLVCSVQHRGTGGGGRTTVGQ